MHNLVFSYVRGPFMFTAQGRYITEGLIDKQTPKTDPTEPGYNPALTGSTTENRTTSHFTLNLNASYNFDLGNSMMEAFASIENVLDEDPQFSSGAVGAINAIYFPILGPHLSRRFALAAINIASPLRRGQARGQAPCLTPSYEISCARAARSWRSPNVRRLYRRRNARVSNHVVE